MVRRASRNVTGYYLPQLPQGLIEGYSAFWDRIPAMGRDILDAIDRGEVLTFTGAAIWRALERLDPEQAWWFARLCGARSRNDPARWAFEGTLWSYDASTARLTRLPDEENSR